MRARWLLSVSAAMLMVVGLIAVLGVLGFEGEIVESGVKRALRITPSGAALVGLETIPVEVLDRSRYRFVIGNRSREDVAGSFWPTKAMVGPTPVWRASFGLLWVVSGGLLVVTLVQMALTRRRMSRPGRCRCCGYGMGNAEVCPECGLSPADAKERARLRLGPVIGVACFLVVCCVALASAALVSMKRADEHAVAALEASAFDYSWYLERCQPRLTGEVVYAEANDGDRALVSALSGRPGRGLTVVLAPGEHTIDQRLLENWGGRQVPVTDVAIIGMDPATTMLKIKLDSAVRVSIQSVTIDCDNSPFLDLRGPGSVLLRDCRVINYNSGAGGSNAVFAVESALLVESCVFDGSKGRAEGAGMLGRAFDLRGQNFLFARGTRFKDNDEVLRTAEAVFDRCVIEASDAAKGTNGRRVGRLPEPPIGLIRASVGFQERASNKDSGFIRSLDDVEVVGGLAGAGYTWDDPMAQGKAAALRIPRDPAYWRRLLTHPDAKIRRIAEQKLGLAAITPASSAELGVAMEKLDKQLTAEVVLVILRGGDAARAELTKIAETAQGARQQHAKALLRVMDLQAPLPDVARATELRKKR